jgi:hypothetical protein
MSDLTTASCRITVTQLWNDQQDTQWLMIASIYMNSPISEIKFLFVTIKQFRGTYIKPYEAISRKCMRIIWKCEQNMTTRWHVHVSSWQRLPVNGALIDVTGGRATHVVQGKDDCESIFFRLQPEPASGWSNPLCRLDDDGSKYIDGRSCQQCRMQMFYFV